MDDVYKPQSNFRSTDMRVLVIGGSGLVGSMITPYLKQDHDLRIFDLQAPSDSSLDYHQGDITKFDDLASAMEGMEGVVYMAMGHIDWQTIRGVETAFDINIKGLHLTFKAAHEAGVTQAVYTSSMSVYDDLNGRTFSDENIPPDSLGLYGFTKRLGEEVCKAAVGNWGLHINALRLCFPTPDEDLAGVTEPDKKLIATAASDVASAISKGLAFQGRFQPFMISGDYENKMMNMSKAKTLLGWEPKTP
jgi:nucleoside-diphosphate-sugar epimerase